MINQLKGFKGIYQFTNNRLGSGAISEVYLGINVGTQEQVAIKIVKKQSFSDNQKNQYYEQELEVSKKFVSYSDISVNICKIYDVIIHPNQQQYYVVMEYCNGGNLLEYILPSQIEDIHKHILEIAVDIVRGIDYLHSKNIMHRDLKPENIYLNKIRVPDKKSRNQFISTWKIGDFGLSKSYQEDEITKSLLGTVNYMAPELLRQKYTKQVDIWSIGCILYELKTKKQLFNSNQMDIREIFNQIKEFKNYAGDQGHNNDQVDQLIQLCLNVSDTERISSQKLKEKIEQLVYQEPIQNIYESILQLNLHQSLLPYTDPLQHCSTNVNVEQDIHRSVNFIYKEDEKKENHYEEVKTQYCDSVIIVGEIDKPTEQVEIPNGQSLKWNETANYFEEQKEITNHNIKQQIDIHHHQNICASEVLFQHAFVGEDIKQQQNQENIVGDKENEDSNDKDNEENNHKEKEESNHKEKEERNEDSNENQNNNERIEQTETNIDTTHEDIHNPIIGVEGRENIKQNSQNLSQTLSFNYFNITNFDDTVNPFNNTDLSQCHKDTKLPMLANQLINSITLKQSVSSGVEIKNTLLEKFYKEEEEEKEQRKSDEGGIFTQLAFNDGFTRGYRLSESRNVFEEMLSSKLLESQRYRETLQENAYTLDVLGNTKTHKQIYHECQIKKIKSFEKEIIESILLNKSYQQIITIIKKHFESNKISVQNIAKHFFDISLQYLSIQSKLDSEFKQNEYQNKQNDVKEEKRKSSKSSKQSNKQTGEIDIFSETSNQDVMDAIQGAAKDINNDSQQKDQKVNDISTLQSSSGTEKIKSTESSQSNSEKDSNKSTIEYRFNHKVSGFVYNKLQDSVMLSQLSAVQNQQKSKGNISEEITLKNKSFYQTNVPSYSFSVIPLTQNKRQSLDSSLANYFTRFRSFKIHTPIPSRSSSQSSSVLRKLSISGKKEEREADSSLKYNIFIQIFINQIYSTNNLIYFLIYLSYCSMIRQFKDTDLQYQQIKYEMKRNYTEYFYPEICIMLITIMKLYEQVLPSCESMSKTNSKMNSILRIKNEITLFFRNFLSYDKNRQYLEKFVDDFFSLKVGTSEPCTFLDQNIYNIMQDNTNCLIEDNLKFQSVYYCLNQAGTKGYILMTKEQEQHFLNQDFNASSFKSKMRSYSKPQQ